jgi:hypothetical protein
MCHTQTQVTTRRSASSPFRPLSRRLGLVLQMLRQRPAFDEVRLLAVRVGLPSSASAWYHNISILGRVLI